MKTPLLTVCLITYNHAEYIQQSIDSILEQQTDFSWQLIIADDFSTDGTRDILEQYQAQHPERIKLILQKKNVGPEKNWMDLLESAKSEYVLYCEGDDYFTDPQKLQVQLNFLEAHKAYSLCFHPVRIIYENGFKEDELFPTLNQLSGRKTFSVADLLAGNFMQANSVMYRWRFANDNVRDVFPTGIIPGDWFLHLLHAQKGKIGFIDREMAVYRRHKAGVWWSTLTDQDGFWGKYGVGHLAFYATLLKLFGDNVRYRAIITSAVVRAMNRSIEVDDRKSTKLVISAIHDLPELVHDYVKAQYKLSIEDRHLLEESRKHSLELEKKVSEITNMYESRINEILRSRSFRVGYLVLHPWRIPKELFGNEKKKN